MGFMSGIVGTRTNIYSLPSKITNYGVKTAFEISQVGILNGGFGLRVDSNTAQVNNPLVSFTNRNAGTTQDTVEIGTEANLPDYYSILRVRTSAAQTNFHSALITAENVNAGSTAPCIRLSQAGAYPKPAFYFGGGTFQNGGAVGAFAGRIAANFPGLGIRYIPYYS